MADNTIDNILSTLGFNDENDTLELTRDQVKDVLTSVYNKNEKPRHTAYSLFMKEKFAEMRDKKLDCPEDKNKRMELIGKLWKSCDKTVYCVGSDWYNRAINNAESSTRKPRKKNPQNAKDPKKQSINNSSPPKSNKTIDNEIEEEAPVLIKTKSILKKQTTIDAYELFCWENRDELEQYDDDEREEIAQTQWDELKDDERYQVGSDWYEDVLREYMTYNH